MLQLTKQALLILLRGFSYAICFQRPPLWNSARIYGPVGFESSSSACSIEVVDRHNNLGNLTERPLQGITSYNVIRYFLVKIQGNDERSLFYLTYNSYPSVKILWHGSKVVLGGIQAIGLNAMPHRLIYRAC